MTSLFPDLNFGQHIDIKSILQYEKASLKKRSENSKLRLKPPQAQSSFILNSNNVRKTPKIKIPGGSNFFSFENFCAYEDIVWVSAFGIITKLSLGGGQRVSVPGNRNESLQSQNLYSVAMMCELEATYQLWSN